MEVAGDLLGLQCAKSFHGARWPCTPRPAELGGPVDVVVAGPSIMADPDDRRVGKSQVWYGPVDERGRQEVSTQASLVDQTPVDLAFGDLTPEQVAFLDGQAKADVALLRMWGPWGVEKWEGLLRVLGTKDEPNNFITSSAEGFFLAGWAPHGIGQEERPQDSGRRAATYTRTARQTPVDVPVDSLDARSSTQPPPPPSTTEEPVFPNCDGTWNTYRGPTVAAAPAPVVAAPAPVVGGTPMVAAAPAPVFGGIPMGGSAT